MLLIVCLFINSNAYAATAILQSSNGTAISAANPLEVTYTGGNAGGWTDVGTNVYTTTEGDNVGIGTLTPSAELEIESTAANDLFMVSDNGPGDTSPFVVKSDGNVGINSATPSSNLDIVGTGPIVVNTNSIGWSVVGGANTACNTTCTFACVAGIDLATGFVGCTDALADTCLCAGSS